MTRYRAVVLAALVIMMLVSFVAPPYPREILLQHIPTTLAILLLALSHRFVNMSETSFMLLSLFLVAHIVGARWIYSFVPYDAWAEALTGRTLAEVFGWTRNHYDRFVHLMYGLLFALPIREFCVRHLKLSNRFAGYIAVEFIMASSMLYEVIEWGLSMTLAPDASERYNGQQGDIWDAHKDMALATVGALVVIIGRGRRDEG